jgi:uncharacterized protein (TIGR02588 family)
LEYGFAALGSFFALMLISVIGWHWLTTSSTPPDITIETLGIATGSGGHTVTLQVTNRGGQTASEVTIEGKAGSETSETVFDFVPGGSQRQGAMVFSADPRSAIRWRVVGYREP